MVSKIDKKIIDSIFHSRDVINEQSLLIKKKISSYLKTNEDTLQNDTIDDIKQIRTCSEFLNQKAQQLLGEQLIVEAHGTHSFPDYLTNVRHDLRNPINAMQGYAELLLEDFPSTDAHSIKVFTDIADIIKEILQAINDINISEPSTQIESGSLEFISQSHHVIPPSEYAQFKKTISFLIVDDIDENCQLLKRFLSHGGYQQIKIAHSGEEALSILKNNKIDIILLDVDMPGMSGIDVLKKINKAIIQQKFMVLMISASDTIKNTLECIKLGAYDFLPKPFNADLLSVRIGSCFDKKWFIIKEQHYRDLLKIRNQNYEDLLKAIFPPVIVKELTKTGQVLPRNYKRVAILFADVVNFTAYCDTHPAAEIVKHIQDYADLCEVVANKFNLQKIKTIGDSFLGAAGMLTDSKNPVLDCIQVGNELIKASQHLASQWQLRVGVHFGSVTGGIVGHRQYLFDIWGDTVNTAARVQTLAEPGTMYVSEKAWGEVVDCCEGQSLGRLNIKGKEAIGVYKFNKVLIDKHR